MSWLTLLLLLHVLVALPVCVHILLSKHESVAPAWIGLVLVSPFVGAGLYWIIGINRVERRARRLRGRKPRYIPRFDQAGRQLKEPTPPFKDLVTAHQRQIFRFESAVHDAPYLGGNRVTPLIGGDQAFPAMLAAIAAAKNRIALSVYIFDLDEVGKRFVEALTAAHARGVKTHVLVDEIGSGSKSRAADDDLARAGIATARFIPQKIKFLPVVNLRNHRKIMVVDGRVGFIGGMNICLNYRPGSSQPVRDLHFKVTGPVLGQMGAVFEEDWRFATGAAIALPAVVANAATGEPGAEEGPQYARIVPDGPDNPFQRTLWIFLGALALSRKSVHILTPYFLPNQVLTHALAIAALRGVDVRVVVPAKTDIKLVNWAMTAKFQDLLEHGVKIYAGGAPFDHSKLMVVDDAWALVGSSNWDQRSLRLNFEANLECYDQGLAATLEDHFQAMMRQAKPVSLAAVSALPVAIRLRNNLARLFTPYL